MGKDFNDKFRDCIDKINNIAKSKGWRNGKAWAAFAVKFDLISTSMKIEYDRCHDLRNTMSHGNAKSIIVHQATYSTAREFLRIIEAKIRENRRNRKIQKFNNTINDKKRDEQSVNEVAPKISFSLAEEGYLKGLMEEIKKYLNTLISNPRKYNSPTGREIKATRDIALTLYESGESLHENKHLLNVLTYRLYSRASEYNDNVARKYADLLSSFL